jgi:CheY-like chemotaxis protein
MQTEADTTLPRLSFPGKNDADRGRVLVIGNDERIRDVLAILTTIEGCDARDAADGPDAHAAIVDWKPDLLLIDLDALTDRYQSVRAFRQISGPDVPIIVLSVDPVLGDALVAMSADRALPKPFAVIDLLQVLDELVGCSNRLS